MTDNRNTILAVILSGLVLIGWQYFFNMPQMEKQRAQQAQMEQAKQAAQPGSPAGSPATPQAGAPPAPSRARRCPARLGAGGGQPRGRDQPRRRASRSTPPRSSAASH